ncbi:E3 ubiquitin-protein ligase MBR1-like [Andrographis paniculata]|uniref:E3 ubiquitin-protein ligase MBR1-like n=1 Tax=Andrographis paniculata TaxID=175694 RepID=UPI0021E953C4|nr:E3 ubiquitin-protein ligase MBR1-like [Andrographis paniculata]XP_051146562.1 E3 ubiquitin-protein ligase MBR1-like [Andrographis paniculata]XP_051146564.1 E3 ubiquitin-protein ligase MBR1-like [Andrographis paniculata]
MQRERGVIDSSPETIDLNQDSIPSSGSMDQSNSWTMLSTVENLLSNDVLSPPSGNACRTPASSDQIPSFSFWDQGESSSSTRNAPNGAPEDDSKARPGWSSLPRTSGTHPRSADWHFVPSSSVNYSTNITRDVGNSLPPAPPKSSHSEIEPNSTIYASSSHVGTSVSSSSNFCESDDAAGPSFGNWGSSCKRKALEGTSEQLYPSGSSSINPLMPSSAPLYMTGPQNLSISSGSPNLSTSYRAENLHPSNGCAISIPQGVSERFARNFSVRSNQGRIDSAPSDTPRGTSVRHFGVNATQMPQPITHTESSGSRLPMRFQFNPNTSSQACITRLDEAGEAHTFHWDGSLNSLGASSSGSGAHQESNDRSSGRNNMDYLMTSSSPETRNISQHQVDWSFAPGASASASSRNLPSAPRIVLGSGGPTSSAVGFPHENQPQPNHQQLSEAAPWIPFPRGGESESGSRRRHFTVLPSASSSDESTSTRNAQDQFRRSSAALLMEMPGDESNGWRTLPGVEGRNRLIRQVLNAMRRGSHLQAEDYTFIDPFINSIAEMHDRHRDMRLDVDNMSYEELLALEEQIGNVSTGLSEEKIVSSMKQRKLEVFRIPLNLEPCCICQENYVVGNDIGMLDCGHEFHADCIKRWLTEKNLCPICKTTALET